MDYDVQHDAAARRFIASDGQEQLGYLSYLEDELSVTIDHTVVRPEHRGKGVAGALAERALHWVRDESSKRLIPQCPYIDDYIAKHPEHESLTTR